MNEQTENEKQKNRLENEKQKAKMN